MHSAWTHPWVRRRIVARVRGATCEPLGLGKSVRLDLFISAGTPAKGSCQIIIVYGDDVRKSFNPVTVSLLFIEKKAHHLFVSGVGVNSGVAAGGCRSPNGILREDCRWICLNMLTLTTPLPPAYKSRSVYVRFLLLPWKYWNCCSWGITPLIFIFPVIKTSVIWIANSAVLPEWLFAIQSWIRITGVS